MTCVRLENVHKKYGKVHAVKGISFECRENEFLVILGPTGAGKTSTLKMIAGLEPVSGGNIFLSDRNVNNVPPENRDVAMVFETYALYPHLSVFDNISFPLRSKSVRMDKNEINERVRETAVLLEIENLLDRNPSKLSGGQKQRVSIGRAMVRKTRLILMDEPLSHLDAKLRHNMRRELKKYQGLLNSTVIYVTHDYLEALCLADRILILFDGLIHQIGTPSEVYHHPADVKVARLLGQPVINLIPVTIENEKASKQSLVSDDKTIRIPCSHTGFIQGSKILLGIRPQFIDITDNMKNPGIYGEVYVNENLGIKNLTEVKVGKTIVRILSENEHLEIGQSVKIHFQEEKMIFFDAHSGRKLIG